MKYAIIFTILLLFAFPASAFSQDYPRYTIEQVDFAPDLYRGMTIYFDGVKFDPALAKQTILGDDRYGLWITSKNGALYGKYISTDDITFYAAAGLAANIVNSQFAAGDYKSNIVASIEKATAPDYYGVIKTYWLAKIIRIEMLDSTGSITRVMIDEAAPTTNPINDAVLAERARWDANGDNRIGIEEAIRALQTISGIR